MYGSTFSIKLFVIIWFALRRQGFYHLFMLFFVMCVTISLSDILIKTKKASKTRSTGLYETLTGRVLPENTIL